MTQPIRLDGLVTSREDQQDWVTLCLITLTPSSWCLIENIYLLVAEGRILFPLIPRMTRIMSARSWLSSSTLCLVRHLACVLHHQCSYLIKHNGNLVVHYGNSVVIVVFCHTLLDCVFSSVVCVKKEVLCEPNSAQARHFDCNVAIHFMCWWNSHYIWAQTGGG
jgi:hypothetical protein